MEQQVEAPVVEPTVETPVEPVVETQKRETGSAFYKAKLAEQESVIQKLKADAEAQQTAQLTEKENFKELWERAEAKRIEAEGEVNSIKTNYFNDLKMSAIKQEAVKQGIRPEALDDLHMLNSDMVELETTSHGNANVLGAKEFVESVKEAKSFWFNDQSAPIMNNAQPGYAVGSTELTPLQVLALEKTDKAAYKKYVLGRLGK